MSLANRAKLTGRAGSRQSLRLRASHGSGLGLRVSHRRTRDWRAPDKDCYSEMGSMYPSSSRGAPDSRRPDLFTNERKRRRKKKRRKGR